MSHEATSKTNGEPTLTPAQRRRVRVAGTIGNVVEWYDFALYGFLAATIGQLFLPADNPSTSLLASYGVFAAGFVMRPIGAVAFGWLGDTIGRGRTMLISVAMMAIPTIALGLLPTYEAIGIAAPVLLVVIRLIQGLSVGGEFSSSVTYLVETASDDHRGRAGSLANVGSMSGMLLGSGAAAVTTTAFDQTTLESWGWRVPFLLGGVLGSFAIALRRHLPRSPHFQAHADRTTARSPLKKVWTQNRLELRQAFLFAGGYGMTFYLVAVYLPGWLARNTDVTESRALQINSLLTLVTIPLMVLIAWIGDTRVRRTRLVAYAFTALAVLAWPLANAMKTGRLSVIIISQLILFVLLAFPLGSAPAVFVELFPSDVRLTGYSISFNLGIGVLGGVTPAIATWLIDVTDTSTVPAWLATLASIGAALALLRMVDRSREPLI